MNTKSKSEINPVDLAIMANRMEAICREMTNTMLLTARSSVIGMARDFSCAIITADNQVLAVAESIPIHALGMDMQFSDITKHHPNYKEGDAFLHNDPYSGNTHAADHTILIPVFHNSIHCFTVGIKAHQADTGNSLPTTYMAPAKDNITITLAIEFLLINGRRRIIPTSVRIEDKSDSPKGIKNTLN